MFCIGYARHRAIIFLQSCHGSCSPYCRGLNDFQYYDLIFGMYATTVYLKTMLVFSCVVDPLRCKTERKLFSRQQRELGGSGGDAGFCSD